MARQKVQWLAVAALLALFIACDSCSAAKEARSSTLKRSTTKQKKNPEPPLQSLNQLDMGAADKVNLEQRADIETLIHSPFFRYVKIDLSKDCPFWRDNAKCMNRDCVVEVMEEDEVLTEAPFMYKNKNLGDISFPKSMPPGAPNGFSTSVLGGNCAPAKDFCVLEDETSSDGVYVDLVDNPERFTGYSGVSANSVWTAIYSENCFNIPSTKDTLLEQSDVCLEKQFFYRIISGLHASISVHICSQFLDKSSGKWVRNPQCFKHRVGNFPERIKNVYVVFGVLQRAVQLLRPLLTSEGLDVCTGIPQQDEATQAALVRVATRASRFAIDAGTLFRDPAVLDEVRSKFLNISQIMDCVSCQKCRLWGKTQVTGIGTALKVLFGIDRRALEGTISTPQPVLSRYELVSLVNTLNRFSESVHDIVQFNTILEDQQLHDKPTRGPRETQDFHGWIPEHFQNTFSAMLDAILPYARAIAAAVTALPFLFAAFLMLISRPAPPSSTTPQSLKQSGSAHSVCSGRGYESDSETAENGPGTSADISESDTSTAVKTRRRSPLTVRRRPSSTSEPLPVATSDADNDDPEDASMESSGLSEASESEINQGDAVSARTMADRRAQLRELGYEASIEASETDDASRASSTGLASSSSPALRHRRFDHSIGR